MSAPEVPAAMAAADRPVSANVRRDIESEDEAGRRDVVMDALLRNVSDW
jgi:hypothetical protein